MFQNQFVDTPKKRKNDGATPTKNSKRTSENDAPMDKFVALMDVQKKLSEKMTRYYDERIHQKRLEHQMRRYEFEQKFKGVLEGFEEMNLNSEE